MRFLVLLLLFSAVVLNPFAAQHAHAQSIDEATFVQIQKIPLDVTASFHGSNGALVGFNEFLGAIEGGMLYNKKVLAQEKRVEFHLRPFNEDAFRELHGIAEEAALTAYDADGRRIDFAEFAKAVGGGQDFAKTVAKETGAVEVRLKRLDEAELRAVLGIAPNALLRLYDVDGIEIDVETFGHAMQSQQLTIGKTIEKATGAVKLQLERENSTRPDNTEIAAEPVISKASMERVRQALGDSDAKDRRPVLLSFYFAECGPCIAEVPGLNRFAANSTDVRSLAVTFDDARTSREFKAKHAFDWPVLSAAQDVIDALGVKTYPTFALIGTDGTLIARSMSFHDAIGGLEEKALRAWIDASLPGSGD